MPLEQAGPPSSAGPRQSDFNSWMRPHQTQNQSQRSAHTPVPIPVPGQPPATAFTFAGTVIPTLANPSSRTNYGGNYGGNDGDQDEVSQQLLGQYEQHIYPPTSQAVHRRNGESAGNSQKGSPSHNVSRQSPGRPIGSASLSSSAYPQQALQNRPSRMRQFGPASSSSANNNNNNNSSSAIEIDELANTGEDDEESDVPPLVMSDLDPRYTKKAPTPKQSPSQPSHSTQHTHTPSLSIRQPQTPHKSSANNTAKKSTTTPLRQPVVSIPLGASPHSTQRSQPSLTTPGRMAPMTVSISLPSLYTPKAAGSAGGNSMVAAQPLPSATKTKSPVVAVGRRSNTSNLGVAPVKGRPKGWKPGMTYREVALRNAGVDPNDPNVPREILMPPRAKKTGRPPGRPRLPGGPRPKPGSSHAGAFGLKRVGRPPIQPIEAVQRSIFCSEQACFAPFMCEWTGCRAELQNMATLRKHVAVVHGRPAGTAKTCQWRQCASVQDPPVLYMDETDTDNSGRTFMEHIEYQHLTPLEWHRGDGFVNNGHVGPPAPPAAGALLAKSRRIKPKVEVGSGTPIPSTEPLGTDTSGPSSHWAPEVGLDGIPTGDLPKYLLDDNGKQVTPLLRDGLLESSTIFWTQEERGRRLKELYRQHQQNMNKRPERGLSRFV